MSPIALGVFNHNRKEATVSWLRRLSLAPHRFEILVLNHGCVSGQRIKRLNFEPPAPLSILHYDQRLSLPSRANYMLRVGKRFEWLIFLQKMKPFDERSYVEWLAKFGGQRQVVLGGAVEPKLSGLNRIARADLGGGKLVRFDGAIVKPEATKEIGWLDERYYTLDAWVSWQYRIVKNNCAVAGVAVESKPLEWTHPLASYFLARNWFLFAVFEKLGWRGWLVLLWEWLREGWRLVRTQRYDRLRLFWGGTVDGWRVWRG